MVMEVITAAIEEAGAIISPWGDKGVQVQAANEDSIRSRYFARMAEKADKDEDAETLVQRRRDTHAAQRLMKRLLGDVTLTQ